MCLKKNRKRKRGKKEKKIRWDERNEERNVDDVKGKAKK